MKKLTREEALKAIPEGWVECSQRAWWRSSETMQFALEGGGIVYAMLKPREPIRKTMTVAFDAEGFAPWVYNRPYTRDYIGLTKEEAAGRTFTVTVEEVME